MEKRWSRLSRHLSVKWSSRWKGCGEHDTATICVSVACWLIFSFPTKTGWDLKIISSKNWTVFMTILLVYAVVHLICTLHGLCRQASTFFIGVEHELKGHLDSYIDEVTEIQRKKEAACKYHFMEIPLDSSSSWSRNLPHLSLNKNIYMLSGSAANLHRRARNHERRPWWNAGRGGPSNAFLSYICKFAWLDVAVKNVWCVMRGGKNCAVCVSFVQVREAVSVEMEKALKQAEKIKENTRAL